VLCLGLVPGLSAGTARAVVSGDTVWVDDDWTDGNCGGHTWNGDAWNTIQGGINLAHHGDTVMVGPGNYSETLNVTGWTNLTILGADPATTIVRPASTLPWNVGSYGTSRQAAVRIVSSTGVNVSKLTFDFDIVKADGVTGILIWDSAGTFSNNVLKNMSVTDTSTAGYSEITTYVRATAAGGYSALGRASVAFLGNQFTDTGRLGIVAHDWVNLTVSGNTFAKIVDDFGSAVELGSAATGSITGNIISGYHTAALSDGSGSAGLYIENCFTDSITDPVAKTVFVGTNEIFGCAYGLYVGNEWSGFAGNVDIVLSATGNNIHDNVDGGICLTDEGKSAGSALNASMSGNTLTNNGGYGYFIYTYGNGDITANLSGETITGHGTGIYLGDFYDTYYVTRTASSSSYSLGVQGGDISGNSTNGVLNEIPALATINAQNNWWGAASGPYHSTNLGGLGDPVSDYVSFNPWYIDSGPTTLSNALTLTTYASGGVITKAPNNALYSYGETVTLTAAPDEDCRFRCWTGDLSGSGNPQSLLMDGNKTVTAVFRAVMPPPPPPGSLGPFEEKSGDGVVEVDVPAGISENPVLLTIGNASPPPPTDGNPNLGAYDVELKDAKTGGAITELTKSITITFHYTAAMLAAAGVTDPRDLVIWYWDADAEPACWVALPTVVDEATGTISTTVDHLTTFIAMVDADFPKLGDIAGHWAQTDILRLASYGAVGGYADGTFRPETAVTRAQYAKFIVATLGITKGTTLPTGFRDASDVQGWAVPYLTACLRDGIMTGANGLLRPNATITRVEAAAMVVRALGLAVGGGGTGGVLTFSDAASVPAWATAFVAEAVRHGLIAGLPGNVFNPAGTLTRAQAATVLSHAVDVK